MQKRRNVLRDLINDNKPTIGTHVHSMWPGIVEVIGHAGTMDYIEFSGEYAPYDLFSLENFGRAIDLFPHMTSMIKIDQEPRTYVSVRAIGSGIQNLLFTDIRNVEDARECIRAARAETPEDGGIVGVGMRRDVGYVMGAGAPEYVEQLREGVVAFMIEKKGAIENLDEILSVGGVDMIQFGPADYAMSIGKPGQFGDPEVRNAQKHAIDTAMKMGIRPRIEIGSFEQAKRWIDMGIKDFCVGWDVGVIYQFCRREGEELAKLLGR
jgi:4-hydroxy-2-oxoheptanedioate aldolase